jgi:hypothetical protein
MPLLLKFSVFAFLAIFLISFPVREMQAHQNVNDDDYKMTKADLKKYKMLSAMNWKTVNIEQDGRPININEISGEAYMYFYQMKETDKKTKKSKTVYKFKMEMEGSDRIFDIRIKGDSVQFIGVKGWNDFRIINLEKDRFSADQVMDGHVIRWNMTSMPKEDPKKK